MVRSALEELIRRARRRTALLLAAEQGMIAVAVACGAAVVLLIAGTQLLSGWAPLALFLLALIVGVVRFRRRLPEPYQVAQRIDYQLQLHDALSTAWHFRETDIDVFSAEVKRIQREQAERAAAGIDPRHAVPFFWPPALRACLLLVATATVLFLLRYGVQRSLDLRRPLVSFAFDPFGASAGNQPAANRLPAPPAMEDLLKPVSVQPPDTKEPGLDPAPDSALGVVDIPDVNNENAGSPSAKTAEKGPGTTTQQERADSGEPGDGASSADTTDTLNQPASPSDPSPSSAPPAHSPHSGPPNDTPLLDRLKDALSNLMNKLNVQAKPQDGGSPQRAQNQSGGPPSANARQQPSRQGPHGKTQAAGEAESSSNQPGDQASPESDPTKAGTGKPGDRDSVAAANPENKSGIGKQDGDKDVKLAEQLAAMGKLSEIIGKRNEKLQGEVLLEVNSSQQTLRTQYSQRDAQHVESGVEIRRDEVPLVYQPYVQQYFEEVRKSVARPPETKPWR